MTSFPIPARPASASDHLINASYRKVGGLHFVTLGRFQASICLKCPELSHNEKARLLRALIARWKAEGKI